MDRLGLVARDNERLKAELRRYGGPVALLAAATLTVVVVRATNGPSAKEAKPRVHAYLRASPTRVGAVRSTQVAFVLVRSGDTLGAVAERHKTSVDRLLALNPGIEPTALHVGQRVRIR